MRAPTLAPSPFGLHWARSHKIVAGVFAVGLVLFGYGVATTGLGILPAGWGLVAVGQYAAMAIGALLASLSALIAVWLRRQELPRPLPRRATLLTGAVGPFIATGAMVVAHGSRVGKLPVPAPPHHWLLLGHLVLGLQLFVGSLEPPARRRRILVTEAVVIAVGSFSYLVLGRGALDRQTIESALAVSGGAVGVFLLIGGLLYLLGNLLVCRPRYHRIP